MPQVAKTPTLTLPAGWRQVDLVIRSRFDPGIHWGVERLVLARRGPCEVWWQCGHTFGRTAVFKADYAPANLKIADWSRMRHGAPWYDILLEGRQTRARLEEVAGRIAEHLQAPRELVFLLDRAYTLVYAP